MTIINPELLLEKDYSNTIVPQLDFCCQVDYKTAINQFEKYQKLQSKTKKNILNVLDAYYDDVKFIDGHKHGKLPSISFGNKRGVQGAIHNCQGRVAVDAAYLHFELVLQLQKYKYNDYATRIEIAKRLKLISSIEYRVYKERHTGMRAQVMQEYGIDLYTYNAIIYQVDNVINKMMSEFKRFEKNKLLKLEKRYFARYKDSFYNEEIQSKSENFILKTTEIDKDLYDELVVIKKRIKNDTLKENGLKIEKRYSIKCDSCSNCNCSNNVLRERKKKYEMELEKNFEDSESIYSFAWEEYEINYIDDELETNRYSKNYLKSQYYENHTTKDYDDWRYRTNRVVESDLSDKQREEIEKQIAEISIGILKLEKDLKTDGEGGQQKEITHLRDLKKKLKAQIAGGKGFRLNETRQGKVSKADKVIMGAI